MISGVRCGGGGIPWSIAFAELAVPQHVSSSPTTLSFSPITNGIERYRSISISSLGRLIPSPRPYFNLLCAIRTLNFVARR